MSARFLVLTVAALVAAPTDVASAGSMSCPGPFVARGGACVLTRDAELDAPLDIASGVTVDCRGRRLRPNLMATEVPVVAVVIHDTGGARLTGCRISGFEHGVYVLRTPGAAANPNRIVGNEIDARVKGISLWGAEGTLILGNSVTVASNFGDAIGLWRGSVDNVVRANLVQQRGGPTGEVAPADFPRGPFTYAPSFAPPAGGIVVATGALNQVMVQVTVVGQLFQFPAATTPGVRGNVIEDNLVLSSGAVAIGLKAKNLGTEVRGNLVSIDRARPAPAITVGAGGNPAKVRAPSTCAARPDRYCFVDADCNPGTLPASADTCVPTPCMIVGGACWYGTMADVDFRSHDVVVDDNILGGGVTTGIDAGGAGMSIVGNLVVGATGAGIAITNAAANDAFVVHNLLVGNQVGLDVAAISDPSAFVFSLNDVLGSGLRPLRTAAGATLEIQLSSPDGQGNYWGRRCPSAFVPLPPGPRVCTDDAAKVCVDDAACTGVGVCATTDADAPNDFLVDPHPFGVPVARGVWAAPCH